MAKLTEAEARRVCEAVYFGASQEERWQSAADWPGYPTHVSPIDGELICRVPLWRIAQRAAEEEGR